MQEHLICVDWLWDPRSLLSNENRGLFTLG